MEVRPTRIPDVLLLEPRVFEDARGFFMETWNESLFREQGCDWRFVQDNHSRSTRGTLRGLHYQLPHPQGKLLRVVSGEVWDVAVDLRRNSPTFGQWVAEILSAENRRQLWVPVGFAHGFYTLSDHADLLYKCTSHYVPESDHILRWDDPELAIAWPLVPGEAPVLSAKDSSGANLADIPTFE